MNKNNSFTFLIGPEEHSVFVSTDVVSNASPVLDRLMNGQMKESQERIGSLPDVDLKTFHYFLSYAYYHSQPCSDNRIYSHPGPDFTRSKIIELLLRHDYTTFTCKGCCSSAPLKHALSFPRCNACQESNDRRIKWKSHCIASGCVNEAGFIDALLCGECLQNFNVLSPREYLVVNATEKLQLNPPSSLKALTSLRFDIPLRAQEIVQMRQKDSFELTLPCTDLLEIGRLAMFADIYNVATLAEATHLALYERLATQNFDDQSVTTIIELARMIYEGTCDAKDQSETHILRRMISECIATKCEQFVTASHLKELLNQDRELWGDLLIAIVKEKVSNT